MIEREKGEKRKEEREREQKRTKEWGGTSVNSFLNAAIQVARRATIHGILRYGDIISQHACPREHPVYPGVFFQIPGYTWAHTHASKKSSFVTADEREILGKKEKSSTGRGVIRWHAGSTDPFTSCRAKSLVVGLLMFKSQEFTWRVRSVNSTEIHELK
jgi:hypothetical protein